MVKKVKQEKMTNHDTIKVFRKLNRVCAGLEEKIKREILALNKALLARVKSADPFLSDFCIEVRVSFRLGEEAPTWDLKSDNLIGSFAFYANLFYPYDEQNGYWQLLADGEDHNPYPRCSTYLFRNEKHSYLMFRLMKDLDPADYDKLHHLDCVLADVNVEYEHVTTLKGKPFKSEKVDWPDINIRDFI